LFVIYQYQETIGFLFRDSKCITTLNKSVFGIVNSAVNTTQHAFAAVLRVLSAGACNRPRSTAGDALSSKLATRTPFLLSNDGTDRQTDRQTDTPVFHGPCSALTRPVPMHTDHANRHEIVLFHQQYLMVPVVPLQRTVPRR